MSVPQIHIPNSPSIPQMQVMVRETTKRLNVFVEMVAVEVEQIGTPEFVFAGINAKLSLPTLSTLIKAIAAEEERVSNVN